MPRILAVMTLLALVLARMAHAQDYRTPAQRLQLCEPNVACLWTDTAGECPQGWTVAAIVHNENAATMPPVLWFYLTHWCIPGESERASAPYEASLRALLDENLTPLN
jgi:hypothetical protein